MTAYRSFLVSFAVGLALSSTAVSADDTDVFFGGVDPSLRIFPNVMLVLDVSASMKQKDSGEKDSRITRMKEAMNVVLDSAANVNIGFMQYTGGSRGDTVLYPITYIDQQTCGEGNCSDVSLVRSVSKRENDGFELIHFTDPALSTISLTDDVLSTVTSVDAIGSIGLRFEQLDIPSGATITSARLSVTAAEDFSEFSVIRISAEDSIDSSPFEAIPGNIIDRSTEAITPKYWFASEWIAGQKYESPDLSTVVQQIVNKTDWCGGSALSLIIDGGVQERKILSYDILEEEAPKLTISYTTESISTGQGCMQKSVVAKISNSADDAEQNLSNNRVDTGSKDLQLATDDTAQLVGLRFNNINLPKSAAITSARLEFKADKANSGDLKLKIEAEDVDSAAAFKSKKRNLSSRTRTAAHAEWENPPAVTAGSHLQSADFSTVVKEIVDRSGWTPGNSIALLLSKISGSSVRVVESINGDPVNAPILRVNYKTYVTASGGVTLTARDEMQEIIADLSSTGGTKIVDTLYEVSSYYDGLPIGGAEGPVYPKPIASECQTNHVVFLTDGGPTNNSSIDKVLNLIDTTSCPMSGGGAGECGPDLASWMHGNDYSSVFSGTQNIITHTVALANDIDYLEQLSDAGGGGYHIATSTQDLIDAYAQILGEVASVETSFVAPGATVNQFNRLSHRDDIYFSLFKPKETARWDGNLKKYKLKMDTDGVVRIFDNSATPVPAVDSSTGYFADGTSSYWSSVRDGSSVAEGGAASKLSLTNAAGGDRKLYTYTGSTVPNNVELTQAGNALNESNISSISKTKLGIAGETDEYHTNLLKWARGVDILDEDEDGSTTDIRHHIGDPMHSRPLILNYASANENGDSIIFVTTNEGYLHAIDHADGKEQFGFMPQELWPNLAHFFENKSSLKHPYGLDGSLSVWLNDLNNNTVVDTGETAYLYLGMRRGGQNYYALDVTNYNQPKLKWSIVGGTGGTSGFEELGQSWSKAIPAKVRIDNHDKRVLFFSGGYDTNQDPDTSRLAESRTLDGTGRAIFMVDAETGERLWVGTGATDTSGPGIRKYFPDMKYSIPSDLRLVDINYDGYTDQLYVGDMGGQVWRFDVNNFDSSEPFIDGGVMAELSVDDDPERARRFYYEPDVALLSEDGKKFLSISIGSGWRANPLATEVADAFFVLRSNYVYQKPPGYGKTVIAGDEISFEKITEADLENVTSSVTTSIDWSTKSGWMMDMEGNGEKILGDSITANGQVVFSSYEPDRVANECDAAIGGGRVYVLDVLNGRPTLNLNNMGEDHELTSEDRSVELSHGGIPPEPAVLIPEEGNPIILVGPEQPLDSFNFGNLTQRTFWKEEIVSDLSESSVVVTNAGDGQP